jgi:hypothetical protein
MKQPRCFGKLSMTVYFLPTPSFFSIEAQTTPRYLVPSENCRSQVLASSMSENISARKALSWW